MKKIILFLMLLCTPSYGQISGCGALCQPISGSALLNLSFFGPHLPPEVYFSRNSVAWSYDASGNLAQANIGAPRFDHDPSTLTALGLLTELGSTNYIRNNTMIGAVSGTPGTLPTYWSSSLDSGFTQQIVGTGTENGMTYIDWHISGTAVATGSTFLYFETNMGSPGPQFEKAAGSAFVKLSAGSLTNITAVNLQINNNDSSGSLLASYLSSPFSPTSAALSSQRILFNGTSLSSSGSAYAQLALVFSYSSGAAIDVTLRIAVPQIEITFNTNATSPILTSGSAVTRSQDIFSIPKATFFSNTGGAFVFGAIVNPNAFTFTPVTFSDGTANNKLTMTVSNTTNTTCSVTIGGVTTTSSNGPTVGTGAFKLGMSFLPGTNLCSLNNGTITAGSFGSAANPSGINTLSFGDGVTQGGRVWYQSFKYWPYPLSQTQLNANTL